jgi:hypothetical protein
MVTGTGENGVVGLLEAGGAPETPPEVPDAPPLRKRYVWADIPEYEGWKVRLWTNFPTRIFQEIQSGDTARMESVLRAIVVEHNRWRDHDGTPFPPAAAPDFYQAIPTEVVAILLVVIQQEITRLPNSLRATRPA